MSSESSPMVADGWNLQIGTVWASLLSAHAVDKLARVIEVGPGFGDKIGLGLASGCFGGSLYVVEPNAAARDWVTHRYRHLLPEANIVPVPEPIPAAVRLLPADVDVLLMNHVLDDLVLNKALPPSDRERVFSRIRPNRSGPPELRQTWQRLFADPEMLRRLGAQVVADLLRLLARTRPRVFGASQYESWYLAANGLAEVDRLAVGLLADLAPVGHTSGADRALLRRQGQDPDRWLVCEVGPRDGSEG